jgi:hypothetical protein
MGQQQLLLLVLTTIIVGMATLAGIQAFSESQRQSVINHMTQKSIEIASDVQQFAQRPAMLRPGNDTAEDDDASALVVGFSELPHYEPETDGVGGDDYFDEVARYSLNGWNSLPDDFNEDACPDDYVNIVAAYSEAHDVSVCVTITGTGPDDLDANVAE